MATAIDAVANMFSDDSPNAVDLLKADHDKVEALFEKVKANEDGNNAATFRKIKEELDVHTHIEEMIFYPHLLDNGDKELKKIVREGIEEQRVKTVIDLADPPETWSALGHDFRVIVHIATWSSEKAVVLPVGALFRASEQWAVFLVTDGRARVRPLEIGHRNNRVAEVLSGVREGDRVVLHPSDRVRDGIAVAQRESR